MLSLITDRSACFCSLPHLSQSASCWLPMCVSAVAKCPKCETGTCLHLMPSSGMWGGIPPCSSSALIDFMSRHRENDFGFLFYTFNYC